MEEVKLKQKSIIGISLIIGIIIFLLLALNSMVEERRTLEDNLKNLELSLSGCDSLLNQCADDIKELNEIINNQNTKISANVYEGENIVTAEGRTFKVCPTCDYWIYCNGYSSMAPTFDCNTHLLFIYSSDAQIGNIVWVKIPSEAREDYEYDYIAHRVIGKENNKFILKGDSNLYRDTFLVEKEDIIGILIRIDYQKI